MMSELAATRTDKLHRRLSCKMQTVRTLIKVYVLAQFFSKPLKDKTFHLSCVIYLLYDMYFAMF